MQTKRCAICHQTKEITEFHRMHTTSDGYRSQCKDCRKAETKRYYQKNRDKIIQYVGHFYKTEHGKQVKQKINKRYNSSEKGLEHKRRLVAGYGERYPEKLKARTATKEAIRKGQLPPVKTKQCAHCDKQALQYHHWSYSPEHWLDVIPLCRQCHRNVHHAEVNNAG